jgi:signal transduction histidine kinase
MRARLLRSTIAIVLLTALVLGLPLAIAAANVSGDAIRATMTVRAELAGTALTQMQLDQQRTHTATDDAQDLRRAASTLPAGWRLEWRHRDGSVDAVGADAGPGMITVTVPEFADSTLTLYAPDGDLRRARWRAYGLVAAAVGVSISVGVCVTLITARRLVAPLQDLTNRAARLGSGDFRTSSRRYGISELDRVAAVLDASARQVEVLLSDERALAADVSHQLRTRLTGLQLRLEELARNADEQTKAELDHALEQTDRLVAVVDGLLAAARSRRAAGLPVIDVDAELDELADSWRDAFAAAGRQLAFTGAVGLRVRATPARLREALGVLLDNALAHGAGEVQVRVQDRRAPGLVSIEVSDEGPGIVEGLVPHIFDRGVSGADSSGLGLGLARAFVEADGGRLELRRARPAVFGLLLASADPGDPASEQPDVPDAPAAAAGPADRHDPSPYSGTR